QLEGVVLVLVGDRLEEEEIEILRQREVDHGLGRMLAALAGDLGDRAMRSLDRVEDEEPVVVGELGLGAERAAAVALAGGGDEPAAHLGVTKLAPLLGERERPNVLPLRQMVERRLGLEREQSGERAAVHLGEHAPAGGGGLVEQGEALPPPA